MVRKLSLQHLVGLTIIIAVVFIFSTFALIFGDDTKGNVYAGITVPRGKELFYFALGWIVFSAIVLSRRLDFNYRKVMILTLLVVLFLLGMFSGVINSRDFSSFSGFVMIGIVGIIAASSSYKNEVNVGVVLSGVLLTSSIYLFAFFPKFFASMFFDIEFIESLDLFDTGYLETSGLLMNNNAVGSVLTVIMAYVVHLYHSGYRWVYLRFLPLIIFGSALVAHNATASIFCLVFLLSMILMRRRLSLRARMTWLVSIAGSVYLVPLFIITFFGDIASYKIDSASVKLSTLANNISIFLDTPRWWIYGAPIRPLLSENTFSDLLYYFGLPGMAIVFVLLVIFGFFPKPPDVTLGTSNFDPATGKMFFLIVCVLLFVQNSVWLPPVSFLFGVMLARSNANWAVKFNR